MPPVTSIPEREAKPRRTAADKRADTIRMARAVQRKRPFSVAADGYPEPTELEIAEGLAHKMAFTNRASKMLMKEWSEIHFECMDTEGMLATTRCAECHVVLFGRPSTVGCGQCGCKERWMDTVSRYGES